MKTVSTLMIAAALATAGIAVGASQASAQDGLVPEITVTPLDRGGPGGTGYYGPYGRDLPGVYMLQNSPLPNLTPSINAGQVRLPSYYQISNQNTYSNPLPFLDAWHGTLGPGIPF